MANEKITELDAITTPVDADLMHIVDDVSGTATNKKITYKNIQDNLTLTASQISDFDTELAGTSNVTPFTPDADYEPATKKYVDDNSGGDVVGPVSAVDENITVFDSTTGKLIKDSGTNISAVTANTSKETNVSTNLSEGTSTETTVDVNSSDGTNATLVSASTSRAGVLTKAKWDEIVANTAKITNVTTNLSEGTSTETTVDVDSSDGTDATLVSASTSRAGVMTKAKFDEVEANNTKVSNVTTNLSAGTLTSTTIDVNSSDGTNATLVEADTTNAGILGSDKWDEIVASTAHITSDGSSHTFIDQDVTSGSSPTFDTIISNADTDTKIDLNAGANTITIHPGQSASYNYIFLNSSADDADNPSIYPNGNGVGCIGLTGFRWSDMFTDAITVTNNIAVGGTVDGIDVFTDVTANNAKVTNVSTNLSEGTSTETTVDVNSSDGTNATLVSASTSRAGVLTKAKFDEIVVNNSKNTNVTTNITVVEAPTNVDIQSSDGTNDTIAAADETNAGVMTTTMYDEHVLNNAKVTNVSTNLTLGTVTSTTMDVNSSDGTNATLISADTDDAGLLTAAKFDEIASNTSASHTQNTDTALGSGAVAADHGTAATDQIINVCYGTSATPPTASTTTEGSLYVQYTA